jgi:hypothetical protein
MDPGTLRGAIDQVDREIAVLGQGVPGQASPLRTAWSRLVTLLAIEPSRAMRNCPRCGQPGMRDATLCGYCWLKLVAPMAGGGGAGANP